MFIRVFLSVGIYARGPRAHLLHGVVEQNAIFHVMDYALCLSESKQTICKEQDRLSSSSQVNLITNINLFAIFLSIFIVFRG